jgi:gliding motility-associated-like protein
VRNCIRYKGLRAGVDTACLVITTADGNTVNVRLIVTVTLPRCGSDILAADSLVVVSNCENGLAKACIEIPLDSIPNYDITDDGTPYINGFEGCRFDTTFAYTYFTVPSQGAAGPYRVDYWVVNGVTYTGTVANMQALVDSMNRWDVGGNWRLVATSLNIVGGNYRNTYGAMKLTRSANGSFGIMQINRNLIPRATNLSLAAGLHTIQVVNRITGCNDVIQVRVACVSIDTINRTMPTGRRDTTCLDTRQLLGSRFTVTNICRTASGERVQFTLIAGTSCVSYLAREVGTERGCFVICDEYGVCDTTIFNVTVTASIASVGPPKLQNDRAETIKNTPILINVLSNDNLGTGLLRGYSVAQKPRHGDVLMSATGAAIYTPSTDYCGLDTFRYAVCTSGGCDTATVTVAVLCKDLLVFNGFSPNGDGVNDEFVIQGIERFPNNILRIYNRWGNEVHRADGYRNNWGGKWSDTDLPTGTYFYVLDNGEGVTTSGYIQIMR